MEKSISKTQVIEFDEAYFKGKDIYVFDDVVTTGASYAIFANQLEIFGGNVLGGLFLGRTHYKYTKMIWKKTEYIKANSVAFSGHRTIAENCKDEIRKKLRGVR